MNNITIKLYNKVIKPLLPKSFRKWRRMRHSIRCSIIQEPNKIYPIVYHIKDATWEHIKMPNAYQLYKSWEMSQYHPSQDILEIKNSIIYPESDIVVTDKGVVWDKYYSNVFSKTIPLDSNIYEYNEDIVMIRKPKYHHCIKGNCISMLGVHATVWAHFIVQFLPKLYYAVEAGLLDKSITIILPQYGDVQINELVDRVVRNHPKVKIFRVPENSSFHAIHCEQLFYIPTSSMISNHADWIAPFDFVIPQRVLDILKNNVINPLKEEVKEMPIRNTKIYLVRRGARIIKNVDEIEQYFIQNGFDLIEPHKMSLREKVCLFSQAKYIVGPQSSAWTNIMFCQEAKGLKLSSLCRTLDSYGGALNNLGGIEVMFLTGDDASASIHTDYNISIGKIDAAYKQLIKE